MIKPLNDNKLRRFDRHKDIINQDRLRNWHPYVIGVGAVGRQVSIQLAAIGCPIVTLIDHDTVNDVNIGPQAYWEEDMGHNKVDPTAFIMKKINSDIKVCAYNKKFAPKLINKAIDKTLGFDETMSVVIFSCVDSISTRENLFDTAYFNLWIDGRVGGESIRVLASDGSNIQQKKYRETIFPSNEAYQPPCTAKMTIYSANIAAGLMIAEFTRHLRQIPTSGTDISFNVLTSEFSID